MINWCDVIWMKKSCSICLSVGQGFIHEILFSRKFYKWWAMISLLLESDGWWLLTAFYCGRFLGNDLAMTCWLFPSVGWWSIHEQHIATYHQSVRCAFMLNILGNYFSQTCHGIPPNISSRAKSIYNPQLTPSRWPFQPPPSTWAVSVIGFTASFVRANGTAKTCKDSNVAYC